MEERWKERDRGREKDDRGREKDDRERDGRGEGRGREPEQVRVHAKWGLGGGEEGCTTTVAGLVVAVAVPRSGGFS